METFGQLTVLGRETGTIELIMIAPASWVRSLPVGPRAGSDRQAYISYAVIATIS